MRTITTRYLEVMTCELCITFKHILWVPNTQISSDITHKQMQHFSIIYNQIIIKNEK